MDRPFGFFVFISAIGLANLGKPKRIVYGSACLRECQIGGEPLTCHYNFTAELYTTMSKACYDCPFNPEDCYRKDCIATDGVKKLVAVVNRKLPGPAIQVCNGDSIIVDILNAMEGIETTLHWHGMLQKDTPYMDGAAMITQCSIPKDTSFRYQFKPDSHGTYWWHSHEHCQRDGMVGSLIVRQPKEITPNGDLYDYDLPQHVIIFQNWFNTSCIYRLMGLNYGESIPFPTSFLINGKGRLFPFEDDDGNIAYTPISRFVVKQGYRYRFRTIYNGLQNCPVEVSIRDHTLTLISTDGKDIKPVEAASFTMQAGERYDFVLYANQTVGLYWIFVRGLTFCYVKELGIEAFQVAVLQYEGASDTAEPYEKVTWSTAIETGIEVDALDSDPSVESTIAATELHSIEEWDLSLKEEPDIQLYITDDLYALENNIDYHIKPYYGYSQVVETKRAPTPQMSHITYKHSSRPLLPDRYQISDSTFCNASTVAYRDCKREHCVCTHVVQIPLNKTVELILVDEGTFATGISHPFHLHGYVFRIVAEATLGQNTTVEDVKALDAAGKIERNLCDPPKKDILPLMGGGYTIVRIYTDNPGYWLFHCHIEVHLQEGMQFVLKVGDNDEMVEKPPNFPICGNYLPRV